MADIFSNPILPLIAFFGVMYFLFIMPQTRRQKNEKKFSEGLKKGDRIITKSGLHGRIAEVSEKNDAVILETTAGKLMFDRSAISLELSKKLNAPEEVKK